MKLTSGSHRVRQVFQQQTDYTCGVCCVRMILKSSGIHCPSERNLIAPLCANPKTGTHPDLMRSYLTAVGLHVRIKQKTTTVQDIIAALQATHWAIVDWSDWGGHYAIVESVDLDNPRYEGGLMTLADPAADSEGRTSGRTRTSVARFEAMWFDRDVPPPTRRFLMTVSRC